MENKLTLGKLEHIINQNFTPPFMQEGMVKAKLSNNGESLSITIGPRDVEISRDGKVIGAGTTLVS